ncbi:50S ribosomal protein L32 [Dehalobacterium formicoaceticum]|uniref:Large ribosomal subunit protein bL32 n=1 Tax=Dehalobacterium formicoaceticum TaxID=51515 RepID=A0ABT1Y8R6_9FIRM|nr:50S ribosomal protein L32 [Dehalobacterium formicoaceticum]MCR6546294.1 50S ribosomal protein L32 [Dehalobacterium formicoaceticum]
MGVPKGKTSKANKRMRRATQKISAPSLSECPQCHAFKSPHHVCPECGYYKGKEVVSKAE